MAELRLRVDTIAGADLAQVAFEMIRLARRLDVNVLYSHNGVELCATQDPMLREQDIIAQYERELPAKNRRWFTSMRTF